jgi:hypothetical protein
VRRTVPPSAEIEERIDRLLAVGVGEHPREALSELARLGARLIIQRAVEDEFDAWLGRARYERRPEAPPGLRNGFRARRVQTAEGELSVEVPQVREAAEPFVSKLFPRGTKLLRTEPLRAMVIGAFVRGLSMRDVESLCEQAGLGKLSKSTASRIAPSCASALTRSGAAISTTSTWPRCSWTRSFSPFAATGPRRQVLAGRPQRPQAPRRRRRVDQLRRRPEGLSRSDRGDLPGGVGADLRRAPHPGVAAIRQLPRPQARRLGTAADLQRRQRRPGARRARALRQRVGRPLPGHRPGMARRLGAHDPVPVAPRSCAARSTQPTRSRACTARSARRSKPADTSPTSRPPPS